MPRLPRRTGAATTSQRLAFLGLAVLVMIIFGSCSSATPPAPTDTVGELSWSRIALPDAVAASSLTPQADQLLVGGRASAGGDHPVLFVVDRSGTARPVPLQPNSPYAEVADLISTATSEDKVVALGVAHGGAHSNFRWTVWTGSTQGLEEFPQTFETFGGQSAGGLLDVVFTSDGPAIAGTWAAPVGGLDAAVWLPRGERWVRQNSAGTALANTAQAQVAPRAATAAGSAMIIMGSLISFGDGAEQRAAVWTWPTRSSPWTSQQLPDAGTHSEALSTRCAQLCWVSGHADGTLALWSFDPAHANGTARRDSTLPSIQIDTDGPGPRTILSGDQPGIVFSHNGNTRLLAHDSQGPQDAGWQIFTAPTGSVLDATSVGDRLYALIKINDTVELWTTDLAATRSR